MKSEIRPYIRPTRVDGYDGTDMHFSCRSLSRPNVIHTLVLNKDEERATCSCEDATYRRNRRYWYLLVPEAEMCIHLQTLRDNLGPILQRAGYLK
jgi:hypothetical protein